MKYLAALAIVLVGLSFGSVSALSSPGPVGTNYLQPSYQIPQPVGTQALDGNVLGVNALQR